MRNYYGKIKNNCNSGVHHIDMLSYADFLRVIIRVFTG